MAPKLRHHFPPPRGTGLRRKDDGVGSSTSVPVEKKYGCRTYHPLSGAMPLEVLERVIENWAASGAPDLHTARKRDLPSLGMQHILDWAHRGKEEGKH